MYSQEHVIYNDGLNAYYASLRDFTDGTCWVYVEGVNFTVRTIIPDVLSARYRTRALALEALDGLYYRLTAHARWPGRAQVLPPAEGVYLQDSYYGVPPTVRETLYATPN